MKFKIAENLPAELISELLTAKHPELESASPTLNAFPRVYTPHEHTGGDLCPFRGKILDSDSRQLYLTTHRVRFDAQGTGSARIISIMLEEVASCEVMARSYPWLLIAAAIVFVVSAVVGAENRNVAGGVVAGIVLAAIFLAIYSASRSQTLSIRSAGASIDVRMQGANVEAARNFIDSLEAAKNARSIGRAQSPVALHLEP